MKRIVSGLITVLWSTLVFAQTATPPGAGNGTAGSPYEIASWENLYWLSQNQSQWTKHYIQTADIDLTSAVPAINTWDGGAGWKPIGNDSWFFEGTYNGNHKTISGLYINRPASYFVGLFGMTSNVIKNLGVINANVTGYESVGILAGDADGNVSGCYSSGTISGINKVGGLVGTCGLIFSVQISDCFSMANVSGVEYVGGLAGYIGDFVAGNVSRCYSTGSVTGTYRYTGGLIGYLRGTVSNCFSRSGVSGDIESGGLVGEIQNGTVSISYATGTVTGSSWIGGFIGFSFGTTLTSFWDVTTSGILTGIPAINVTGVTGKTNTEMKQLGTYSGSGWDIIQGYDTAYIWNIHPQINDGYPYLSSLLSVKIHYVDHSASGANNGTSWTDAFVSLQAALEAANFTDHIWVAAGTYKPSKEPDGTMDEPRHFTFQMVEGVEIYGGFAGTEEPGSFDLDTRDFTANETILSGDLNNNDEFDITEFQSYRNGTGDDNCYQVIFNSDPNLTMLAVLDGFTVTGGYANAFFPGGSGAGMLNLSSCPTVRNTIFKNNKSNNGGILTYFFSDGFQISNLSFIENNGGDGGGGLFLYELLSNSVLTNALFLHNRGVDGGGLENVNSTLTISNATFYGNEVFNGGGAIMNRDNGSLTLDNCILWNNSAGGDGNEIYHSGNTTTLNHCCYKNDIGDVFGNLTIGSGNINAYPLFVDTTAGDLRLFGNSPCVNTGENSYNAAPFDLRGQVRIQNTTIDMGTYEWTVNLDPESDCLNPDSAGVISGTQTICYNTVPSEITSLHLPGNYFGNPEYKWQYSISDSTSNFVDIPGSDTISYAPSNLSQTTWFKRLCRVDCKADWTNAAESNVVKITVLPDFSAGSVSASQTICDGSSAQTLQGVAPAGGGLPYSYQWQQWDGTAWEDIAGETLLAYSPGVPVATTRYRLAQVSSGGCGTLYTNEVTVSINTVDPGEVDSDQNLCPGEDVAALNNVEAASGSGIIAYQWQISRNGIDFDDLVLNATNANYDHDTLGSDAWFRRRASSSLNGTECHATSNIIHITVDALPLVVAATGDTAICLGESTVLSASGAASYAWDQGLGAGSSHSISPTTTTTYTVSGTDANGCTATDQVSITVNPLPIVLAAATDHAICLGESTVLSASGAASYAWNQGLGAGSSHNVSPATTTSYTVSGTDANGCSATDQVSITVNPLPMVLAAATDHALCLGESTVLSASGATSYAWDQGLGAGSSHSVSPATTTTYTVSGTDANGCTATDQVSITVYPRPTVLAAATDQAICLGESTDLSVTGATSYVWDQSLGAGSNHSVSPTSTTTYSVTGTDANGCSATGQIGITVNPLPLVMAGASDNVICLGESTDLFATGATTYVWDQSLGAGSSHSVTPTSTTTYSLTGTDANGCTATDQVSITVNPLPMVLAAATDQAICLGESTDLSVSGAASYAWDQGLGAGSSHSVSPTSTTNYSVTGTDANGCSAIGQISITVNALPLVMAGASDNVICLGESTDLSATGATSYVWDQSLGTGSSHNVSPTSTTTYSVTGTDANGCSMSDDVNVQVLPLPIVSIRPEEPAICEGDSILLLADGGTSYLWSTANQGPTLMASPDSTTNYSVVVTGSNACSASGSIVLRVYERPAVYAGKDTTIHFGSSLTFSDAAAQGNAPLEYSWSPASLLYDPAILHPTAVAFSTTEFFLRVTDVNGCFADDSRILGISSQGNTLSGQVVYDNTPQTPMQGVGIILTHIDSLKGDTLFSDIKGYFSLDNIPSGVYSIRGTYTQPWPWGSVNATDALVVMKHFVGLGLLNGVRNLAADVTGTFGVNVTDALLMSRRFTGEVSDFPVEDWVMEADTLHFGIQDSYHRMYKLLSSGDVNGSYLPHLKQEPLVGIASSSPIKVLPGQRIDLPLCIDAPIRLGALSASFSVSPEVQMMGVKMAENIRGNLDYVIEKDEVRISWFNEGGTELPAMAPLFYLEVGLSQGTVPCPIPSGKLLELANPEGQLIKNVNILVPGLQEMSLQGLSLRNHPNPYRTNTQISYLLPENGLVRLSIHNALGEVILTAFTENQDQGNHQWVLDVPGLSPGIYFCKLLFQSENYRLTEAIPLIKH